MVLVVSNINSNDLFKIYTFLSIQWNLIAFQAVANPTQLRVGSKDDFGIVIRSMEFLFNHKPDASQVNAIFFEIYNETLVDLLKSPNQSESKPIGISAASQHGQITDVVINATKFDIQSSAQFDEVLRKVHAGRTVSATARNSYSSRSHFVVQIEFVVKFGNKLTFLDLAGCENSNDHLEPGGIRQGLKLQKLRTAENVVNSIKNSHIFLKKIRKLVVSIKLTKNQEKLTKNSIV